MNSSETIVVSLSKLFIPRRILSFSVYEFQLVIQSISSAYTKINPSEITANLVPLGTSMITR